MEQKGHEPVPEREANLEKNEKQEVCVEEGGDRNVANAQKTMKPEEKDEIGRFIRRIRPA